MLASTQNSTRNEGSTGALDAKVICILSLRVHIKLLYRIV